LLITQDPELAGQALNMARENRWEDGLTAAGRALAKGGISGLAGYYEATVPIEHNASSGKSSWNTQKCSTSCTLQRDGVDHSENGSPADVDSEKSVEMPPRP
jgi:hypothetical protein